MSKKIFTSLVLVLFLFSLFLVSSVTAAPAYQSTVTPSPTRDYLTPPFTPTPGGGEPGTILDPINFNCPAGTPVGYGEVEPDAGWLAACGHCLPTPTPFATLQANASEFPIQCDTSVFSCHQLDEDTIYFTAGILTHEAYAQFFTTITSDIYVYYQYSGYSAYHGVDGSTMGDTGNPIYRQLNPNNTLETEFTYPPFNETYIGEDQEAGVWSVWHKLNEPYVQNFGCSRIYVSLTHIESFPEIPCAITGELGPCPPQPPQVEGDFTGCSVVEGDGFCSINDENSVITYTFDEVTGAGSTEWNFSHLMWTKALPGTVTVYLDFHILIPDNGETTHHFQYGYIENGVATNWFDTTAGGFNDDIMENHVVVSDEADEPMRLFINNFHELDGISPEYRIWGNVYVATTGAIVGTPVPCNITPVPPGGPITGSVCSIVITTNPPVIDWDIFDETPSICTIIPGVSWGDAITGGLFGALLDFLVPEFIDFLDAYSLFPASTFCYHFVTFRTQYFLNVSISLSFFAGAMLTVWALRKFTSK